MSKPIISRKAGLIFSLIGCFMLATFAAYSVNSNQTAVLAAVQNKCAAVTDKDIVKSIYGQIKIKYDGQKSHINVWSKDNIVTLEGWVTTKDVRKEIEKYAKKTNCAKKVINRLTVGVGAGCGPGQIKCGDVCISSQSECNIGMPEN